MSPGPARLLPVSSSASRDGGGAGSGEDEQDGSSQSGRRPMYFPPAGTIDPPSWLSWFFYPAAIQQIVHSRTHSSTDPAGPLSPLELADLLVRPRHAVKWPCLHAGSGSNLCCFASKEHSGI